MIQVANDYWVQPEPKNLILYRVIKEKKDGEIREVKTRLGYMRDWKQVYDKLLKDAVQQEELESLKAINAKMDALRNELFLHFSAVLEAASSGSQPDNEESDDSDDE